MDIPTLQSFFGWCTVLNAMALVLAGIILAACGDVVYRLHSFLFRLTRDQYNGAVYGWLGTYKMAVTVFFLVPWIALKIIG